MCTYFIMSYYVFILCQSYYYYYYYYDGMIICVWNCDSNAPSVHPPEYI
jgi:hypothetical protein